MDLEAVQEPPVKKAKLEENENTEDKINPPGAEFERVQAPLVNENGTSNGHDPQSNAPGPSNTANTQPPAHAVEAKPAQVSAIPALTNVDTYCTRELRHMEREKSGELKAFYIQNDGQPDSGRFLIGLKNVFSKCLPNMPKTYITRLLFDRRHRSVVIVRNDSKVIGGITYRPFHEKRFAEIAFCAVAQTLQVSGFGTRLMNWTKLYARDRDACEYFLTYADNAAVGYFSKQGFTKHLTMPKERWHGYIKDYDGGTLMECYIHPTLPFTDIPGAIAAQRTALDSAVRQYTTAHVVHEGLKRWEEGGQGGPMPIGSIPGVKEAGWTAAQAAAALPKCQVVVGGKLQPLTPDSLKALQLQLLEQLEGEKELIWPFLKPVDRAEVPDYYDVIKNPIDVATIKARTHKGGFYITMDIFIADVLRMFNNARIYNNQDTVYHKSALKLSNMFQSWVNAAVHYEV